MHAAFCTCLRQAPTFGSGFPQSAAWRGESAGQAIKGVFYGCIGEGKRASARPAMTEARLATATALPHLYSTVCIGSRPGSAGSGRRAIFGLVWGAQRPGAAVEQEVNLARRTRLIPRAPLERCGKQTPGPETLFRCSQLQHVREGLSGTSTPRREEGPSGRAGTPSAASIHLSIRPVGPSHCRRSNNSTQQRFASLTHSFRIRAILNPTNIAFKRRGRDGQFNDDQIVVAAYRDV